jgi:bacterial/archaeal transporter family protein
MKTAFLPIPRWLMYTLLATALWGGWGIVSALVSRDVSPLVIQVVSTVGIVPAALVLLLAPDWNRVTNLALGVTFAALSGLFANVGNLCMLRAFSLHGPVSMVLPASAMYPLVTALLAAVFLKERLNRIQAAGFVIALIAGGIVGLAASDPSVQRGAQGFHVNLLSSSWALWTSLALVAWGLTGFFSKIATGHSSSALCTIVFALASIPIAVAILLLDRHLSFELSGTTWLLSLLFGALFSLGSLATFASYRYGKATVVTAIIALYPAITVMLAVLFLKEKLDSLRMVSLPLALAAGVALSYEPAPIATTVDNTGD